MTMKCGIGVHYVKGFVKDHILLYLWEKFEATGLDATGPDIRKYVRDNFGVRERSGIDKHLKALQKEKLITRGAASQGRETGWKLNPSSEIFKKIYEKILGSLPNYNEEKGQCNTIVLLESRFAQKIIMPQLIEKIRSSNINQQIKEELYVTLGISPNTLIYTINKIESNGWEKRFDMLAYRNQLFRDLYDEEISNKEVLGYCLISQVILHTKNDKAFKIGHQFIWGDIEDFGKPERKKRRRNGKAKTATDTEKQLKKGKK